MKLEIIVSAYNNIEMTKLCYRSIMENTTIPFRLIIVENCGSDGTREWLKTLKEDENFKIYLPDNNIGGVGVRNYGIENLQNDTEFFISADNDTVFTKYWDIRMEKFFSDHKDVGLAGPASNFAGNPQLIQNLEKLELGDYDAIQKRSEEIYKKFPKFDYAPKDWPVVGFSMFIPRHIVDKIGKFDINLIAGWDDTDYSRRIEKIGYKLAYIHYIYIHHWGHASKGTPGAHYTSEAIKSREYMLNKWGWI